MGDDAKSDSSVRVLVLLAFAVSAFMIFAGLGKLPLMQPDEERNAEVAREMKQSGNWLIPTYDCLPYLDKPSFFFKTVALSFSAFGETSAAARLPSALFGFGLLAMLFCFCRRAYSARTAALAMLVVGTSPLYVGFSRLVIFDMTLAFFVCGAIFAGYLAEEKDGQARSRWYLLGAVSSAFATLVKGPVGFILPLLVLGVFNWLDDRRGTWKRLFAPRNVVIFFAITLPWFLGVVHYYRDFAYYGVIEESFHRYTTNAFRRTGPIYYYIPWIFAGCFAWSVMLPESMIAAWRSRSTWARPDRLFIVWSLVLLVFFSVSKSKRPDYILTVIVALGALTARVFVSAINGNNPRATATVLRGIAGMAFVSALVAIFLVALVLKPELLTRLVRAHSKEFAWLVPVYVPTAGALVVMTVLAAVARWKRDARLAFAAFVLLPCTGLLASADGLKSYADVKSTRTLADKIPTLPPQTEIVCFESFPVGLPFYLKRCVTVVSGDGKELTSNYIMFMLRKTDPWPAPLMTVDGFGSWLKSRTGPVYLIARKERHEALDSATVGTGHASTELVNGWWATLLPAPGGT